jgi:hypothetical protein
MPCERRAVADCWLALRFIRCGQCLQVIRLPRVSATCCGVEAEPPHWPSQGAICAHVKGHGGCNSVRSRFMLLLPLLFARSWHVQF